MRFNIKEHIENTLSNLPAQDEGLKEELQELFSQYDKNEDGNLDVNPQEAPCSSNPTYDIDQTEYEALLSKESELLSPYNLWRSPQGNLEKIISRSTTPRDYQVQSHGKAPAQRAHFNPEMLGQLKHATTALYETRFRPILNTAIDNLDSLNQTPEQTFLALIASYFVNPQNPAPVIRQALIEIGVRPSEANQYASFVTETITENLKPNLLEQMITAQLQSYSDHSPSVFFNLYNHIGDIQEPLATLLTPLRETLVMPLYEFFCEKVRPSIRLSATVMKTEMTDLPAKIQENPWELFASLPNSPFRNRLLASLLNIPYADSRKAFLWIAQAAQGKPYSVDAELLRTSPDLPVQIATLGWAKQTLEDDKAFKQMGHAVGALGIGTAIGVMTANPLAGASVATLVLFGATTGVVSSGVSVKLNEMEADHNADRAAGLYASGTISHQPLVSPREVDAADKSAITKGSVGTYAAHMAVGGVVGGASAGVMKPNDFVVNGVVSLVAGGVSSTADWAIDADDWENRSTGDILLEGGAVFLTGSAMGGLGYGVGHVAGTHLNRTGSPARSAGPKESTSEPSTTSSAASASEPETLPTSAAEPLTTAYEVTPSEVRGPSVEPLQPAAHSWVATPPPAPRPSIEFPLGSPVQHEIDVSVATYRANTPGLGGGEIIWVGAGSESSLDLTMYKVRLHADGSYSIEGQCSGSASNARELIGPYYEGQAPGAGPNKPIPQEVLQQAYPYMADPEYRPEAPIIYPKLNGPKKEVLIQPRTSAEHNTFQPAAPSKPPIPESSPLRPLLNNSGDQAYVIVNDGGKSVVARATWKDGKLTIEVEGRSDRRTNYTPREDIAAQQVTFASKNPTEARAMARGPAVHKAWQDLNGGRKVYVVANEQVTEVGTPTRISDTGQVAVIEITAGELNSMLDNGGSILSRGRACRTGISATPDIPESALATRGATPLEALQKAKPGAPLTKIVQAIESGSAPLTPEQLLRVQYFLKENPHVASDRLAELLSYSNIQVPDVNSKGKYVVRTVSRENLIYAMKSGYSDIMYLYQGSSENFSTVSSQNLRYASLPNEASPPVHPFKDIAEIYSSFSSGGSQKDYFVLTDKGIMKVSHKTTVSSPFASEEMLVLNDGKPVRPNVIQRVFKGESELRAFLDGELQKRLAFDLYFGDDEAAVHQQARERILDRLMNAMTNNRLDAPVMTIGEYDWDSGRFVGTPQTAESVLKALREGQNIGAVKIERSE